MDVSRLLVDELRQGVDVGAQQLLESAVVENLAHNRVLPPQRLQHFLVGDVLSRLRLLGLRVELQAVEEHLSHLLRAGDVEVDACLGVYLLFECQHLLCEEAAGLLKSLSVNHHARLFHLGQHRHQGHLYLSEEVPESFFVQLFLQAFLQPHHVGAAVDRQQVVEIVTHFGVQNVVGNLRVEHRQVGQLLLLERLPLCLQVVSDDLSPVLLRGGGNHDEGGGRKCSVLCRLMLRAV